MAVIAPTEMVMPSGFLAIFVASALAIIVLSIVLYYLRNDEEGMTSVAPYDEAWPWTASDSWYGKKAVEDTEALGIERDLRAYPRAPEYVSYDELGSYMELVEVGYED